MSRSINIDINKVIFSDLDDCSMCMSVKRFDVLSPQTADLQGDPEESGER